MMVNCFLLTLAASGVMLHLTILGDLWTLAWGSSMLFEILLALPFVIFGGAAALNLGLLDSDLNIEEKKKPLAEAQ